MSRVSLRSKRSDPEELLLEIPKEDIAMPELKSSTSTQGERMTVDANHFNIIKLLGKGSFGKAFVAKCLVSSQLEERQMGEEQLRVRLPEQKNKNV